MPLPPPASFVVSGRGPSTGPSSSSSSLVASISKDAGYDSCRICRYNMQMGPGTGMGSRAWVAFKDERPVRGVRPAWVHMRSGGAEDVEAVVEGVASKEERGRVLKRQKEEPPKLDLLAIPGVGPRNLRKLVDKGIAGIAELKKIYRDTFFGKSSEKMVGVEYLASSV